EQVYVVPVSYAYHDGAIFFGSINGEKIEFLRSHPQGVCFEVDDVDDALNWTSVIVRGDYEELIGEARRAEREAALARAAKGPMHDFGDGTLTRNPHQPGRRNTLRRLEARPNTLEQLGAGVGLG